MGDDKIEIVETDADEQTGTLGGDDKKGDNEGDDKSTVGTLNTMDAAV